MRVGDVARVSSDTGVGARASADRWQRSMQFLRTLGDTLSWHDDRLALTVFAHIATPQIRLTRDPNTLFFFLDHLYDRPPFRLEDDTTWDTNLEIGIAWGLRVVDKDDEMHGRSQNARLFVVLSDGESWSGEVAKAVASVAERGIPIDVIGVGSLGGGPLPAVKTIAGRCARVAGGFTARTRGPAAHCCGGSRTVLRARSRSGSRRSPTRSCPLAGGSPAR